jgi:DNA-binding CsgD family transcriptional regulator
MRDLILTRALDFIATTRKVTTMEALFERVTREIMPMGVERATSVNLGMPGTPVQIANLIGTADQAWAEYYQANGFISKDPVAKRAISSLQPFTWEDVRRDFALDRDTRMIFDAARAHKIESGLIVPVASRDGSRTVITFTGQALHNSPENLSYLQIVATYLQMATERISSTAIRRPIIQTLTDRQLECLKWVSVGKTDFEIGEVLGLSEATINRHIERAKARLGVRSRAQAIAALIEADVQL